MDEQPSKRRKTSPTTSVPIDAPATPSQIPVVKPVASTLSASRPSFASPTKASLSRHNPQLLNRPSSSGSGSGKNLNDIFARALGENRPNAEQQSVTTGEDGLGRPDISSDRTTQEIETGTRRAQKARTSSFGGAMASKPRRLSRSPVKQADRIVEPMWGTDDANPFGKKGLRRTPPLSSQAEVAVNEGLDPFKKTELRRSPTGSSHPVRSSQKENEVLPEASNTPTALAIARTGTGEITRKPGLRRSPVASTPVVESVKKAPPVDQSPFAARRTGLRRSPLATTPVASTPAADAVKRIVHAEQSPFAPRTSALRRSPVAPTPFVKTAKKIPQVEQSPLAPRRSGLRRSPVASQPVEESQKENLNDSIEAPLSRVENSQRENLELPTQPDISNTPTEPVTTRVGVVEILSGTKDLEETIVPSPQHAPRPPTAGFAEMFQSKPPAVEPEEPDLPPTPIQRGIPDPVVTTPPTGIHDTPGKRARRSKALSEKIKSSPLKPKDAPPPSPSKVAFKNPVAELVREPAKEPAKQVEKLVSQLPQLMPPPPRTAVKRRKSARFLIPEDLHAAKKKERDVLLEEIQRLQADVALANAENERLRLRSEAKGKSRGPTAGPNQDAVLDMLRRATAPPQTKAKAKPNSIFKSIDSFLPFRSKRRAATQVKDVSEEPLPSYLPLSLDDPLPYLQVFTPLTWSSTITLHPSSTRTHSTAASTVSESDQAIIQKHVLTATHPQGFFSSRLSLTVHTPTLTIQDIMILRLPMCAEQELGCFIRPRAKGDGPLGGSVGVITWAMGRWCEVSLRRAGFWCAVESQLGSVEARKKTFGSSKARKRKRGASVVIGEEDEDVDEDGQEGKPSNKGFGKWSRKQLLPHLGRSSMELSSTAVDLRIEWRIGFDWTGEVESKLGATARIPRTWNDQDERSSLSKIPEMFDKLVKEKGPLGAVGAVAGLLMGP